MRGVGGEGGGWRGEGGDMKTLRRILGVCIIALPLVVLCVLAYGWDSVRAVHNFVVACVSGIFILGGTLLGLIVGGWGK